MDHAPDSELAADWRSHVTVVVGPPRVNAGAFDALAALLASPRPDDDAESVA